jgi:hypothetical protein
MDARQIAGRFAAYTWYMEVRTPRKPLEAVRFARTHWQAFVPVANAGFGRLLQRIACRPDHTSTTLKKSQNPRTKGGSRPNRGQSKATPKSEIRHGTTQAVPA